MCLYSDGLVERRGVVIDDNIEKLRTTVTAQAPELVCVEVMQQLIGFTSPEDDVAVLVARRLTPDPTTRSPALPRACKDEQGTVAPENSSQDLWMKIFRRPRAEGGRFPRLRRARTRTPWRIRTR
jgi:hypothetical protein